MHNKKRAISNEILQRHADTLEQVRQSPRLYATLAENDEVVSYVFDQYAELLSLTGRGIGRARLWRAHEKAYRKPHEDLPSYALDPTDAYVALAEAFAEARVVASPTIPPASEILIAG